MFFSAKDWESWVPAYLEQHFDLVEKQRGGTIKPCTHIWQICLGHFEAHIQLLSPLASFSLAWKGVQQTYELGPAPHTNSLKMGVLLNCMSKMCVFPCTFWRVAVLFLRKIGTTNLEIARIRSKVLMFFAVLSIVGTVTALLFGRGMQVPCCLNLAWAFGWATYHWANIMHIQLKWELTLNFVTLDALVSQF